MRQSSLSKYRFVGIDTNIFIYQFTQNPDFGPVTKKIFNQMALNQLRAVTSIITLIELLSKKAPEYKIKGLRELFLNTPNLSVLEVDTDISIEAARIRREYKFRLPDAIQLATALNSKAKAFITNDERLKIFKELQILILSRIF